MVGRITLINSVNSAIPIHQLHVLKLSVKISNILDRLNRDFVWGSFVDFFFHLVNWNVITKRKAKGGLDIKVSNFANNAILAKLCWRFLKEPDWHWVKTLNSKYFTPSQNSTMSSLWIWKGSDAG
ncbi:hypothetical protein CFOL_v3_06628 [Cephalotus follicularis]|uniref:Zf-RVT domain-containing protein n=1 Tax=Cephalotus follicularis TaxID=3775 RepID=A0A1Q3B521_CEPFO|nr:hypothetical protein CFOL_v3_06628 [Cephalotus follicularis]